MKKYDVRNIFRFKREGDESLPAMLFFCIEIQMCGGTSPNFKWPVMCWVQNHLFGFTLLSIPFLLAPSFLALLFSLLKVGAFFSRS